MSDLLKKLTPYEWQIEAIDMLEKEKRVLVQAPPGQGKSLVGVLADERVGKGDTLLVTHNVTVVQQWQKQWNKKGMTIQSICNLPEGQKIKAQLVILDECQHYESEVWSQLYDRIDCEFLLGLSATPGESYPRFDAVYVLPWSKAKLPSFKFKYHKFRLDSYTQELYDEITKKIQGTFKAQAKAETREEVRKLDKQRMMLALKRRRLCHESRARKNTIIKALKTIKGVRTLVVSETIIQAEALAQPFNIAVCHSKVKKKLNEQRMDDFKSGSIDIISSVKMLKEGFDCPEIDTLIVASSALTEAHYVQLMGRALRFLKGKSVLIHVFIAEGTSDTKLMGLGESITGMADKKKILKWKWDKGTAWSVDTRGGVFSKEGGNRIYYNTKPEDIGKKILRVMPKAGKFRIYKGEVLAKAHNRGAIQELGYIGILDAKPRVSYSEPVKWEDLFSHR